MDNEDNVSGVEPQNAAPEETLGEIGQESATDEVVDDVEQPAAETDESGETGEEQHEQQDKRKVGGVQRKIDKLTKAKSEAEREAEFWKQQALKGGYQPEPAPQPVQPSDKPRIEQFPGAPDAFIEALADWKIQQKELHQQQELQVQAFNKRLQAFVEENPDYEEVMLDVADLPAAPEVGEMIRESSVGPAIAYHLAKNPDLLEKINSLPPKRRYAELGKIEDKVSTQSKPAPVAPNKVSKAPPPAKPVSGTKTSVGQDVYDPNLTPAQYRALRLKERQAKGLVK